MSYFPINAKSSLVRGFCRGPHTRGLHHIPGASRCRRKVTSTVPPVQVQDLCDTVGTTFVRLLHRLKAESAEERGPEGAQVQVSIMFMHLADVGDHLPIRIMQASPEGTAIAEL